jgi:hypothetical protein
MYCMSLINQWSFGSSMLRLLTALITVFFLPAFLSGQALCQSWPLYDARWKITVYKDTNVDGDDIRWIGLNRNNPHIANSLSANLLVAIYGDSESEILSPASSGIELRYTVRGTPVSGWLQPPFNFNLHIDNTALDSVPDGISDLSVEVRGATRANFQPRPAFVHLWRGRSISQQVPIITGDDQGGVSRSYGPGVVYVDAQSRNWRGYPVDPSVSAWTRPPYEEDLYLELMAPHTPLFMPAQMWWEHPAFPGIPFIRGMPPKWGEDHRALRPDHERFPYKDGLRGVAWMSSFVTGAIRSDGTFAFAEAGGRVGWMRPNGTVVTLAGFRVNPQRDPMWVNHPISVVRQNMELRGRWLNGIRSGEAGGMRTPLDVAIDPQNENILYVAAYEDHCIWKVQVNDTAGDDVDVSVFAGDVNHGAGFADGTGTAARFRGPASLVWDTVSDRLYVADQDNDAIRAITRSGIVTTLFGEPGMENRLISRGSPDVFDQDDNRSRAQFEVSSAQAGNGIRPEIYVPQTIRVDSQGNILILELGFGAIRRIVPSTGVTRKMAEINQKFARFDRGWAWFDIDRWGNSGPRDGIYWVKFVGASVDGDNFEHFNEIYAWTPPTGGLSKMIFPQSAYYELWPDGWGPIASTGQPHYPWLVAVDPRGAVLFAGGGDHGLVRLRKRKTNDPMPLEFDEQYSRYELGGAATWLSGSADSNIASPSMALKHGWETHNYLGFPDAWGIQEAADTDVLDMFSVPDHVRNNANARADLLMFLRMQASPSGVGAPANSRPRVNAGRDKRVTIRRGTRVIRISLRASISDDGLPAGAVSGRWRVVRGKNVTIHRKTKTSTPVTFRRKGTYTLRFTASDGSLSDSDDIRIIVR